MPTTYDQQQARLARIQRIASLMDAEFRVAGVRFGLDSLIGLMPAFGDAIGGLISLYIIWEARKIGVPREVINKMIARVLLDVFIGGIPVLGDVFDIVYKANQRNVATVEQYVQTSSSS